MTTFLLVRHAERTHGELLVSRLPGVDLTARGRQQAAELAAHLANTPIDRLIASPRHRARATLAPLAAARGLAIISDPRFDELDFGAWTGRAPAELAGDPAWERYNAFRSDAPVPEGETALALQARVLDGLRHWRDAVPDGTVLVCSHAEPIRAALLFFAGRPLSAWPQCPVEPASVHRLELSARHARLGHASTTAA